jgi:hypothetical protein
MLKVEGCGGVGANGYPNQDVTVPVEAIPGCASPTGRGGVPSVQKMTRRFPA